jgi:predicted metal-dependent hydrolase
MNESIPDEFWQGVEQFNTRQFYTCHDTLEALWMEASDPEKTFYQGILQLAVALYHLGNGNWRGAVILLGEGTNKLQRYSPNFSGINVEKLIDSSYHLLTKLQQAGSDVSQEIIQEEFNENPDLLPVITIAQPE